VPEPVGPSAVSTEADPVSSQSGDASKAPSPPYLNLGATVWGTTGPLTPVVLSETERRFKFRGLPQAVGAARRALREWEGHFEPDLFYDLSLCVSELVTKSVQQAVPARGDEIELAVSRHNELVRAEVMEHRRDVVVTQPGAMDGGDWGMFIVDRVADRWGVDRSIGTRLWCEIDLAGNGRSRDGLAMSGRSTASSL
jgi:anti-sigma regulatory factor (Ser/Thr protein kinase)